LSESIENCFDMKLYGNEKTLLESLKNNDEKAFEYLFKTYYQRLYVYANRFIKDDDISRDILQECFIKVWEKRKLLKSISLSSLLFTMVRNACLNHIKHCTVVKKHLSYLSNIGGEERLYNVDFFLDFDKKLLQEELEEQIGVVMEKLPDRAREVFTLSRFEGLKNREISERLGISTTAVEKNIARAIKYFSDHFKAMYPTDVYIMVLAWIIFKEL